MDWKLSYIVDEEDFHFLHAKGSYDKTANGNGKDAKSEGASTV